MKTDITIGELIELLTKYDSNKKVTVQFRDGGGDYFGEDNEIYLVEKKDRIIL